MKKESKNKKLTRYWIHRALRVGAFCPMGYRNNPKLFTEILQEIINNPKMRNGYLSDEYMYGFKTKGKHGAS